MKNARRPPPALQDRRYASVPHLERQLGASLCRLRPDRNLPTICRVDPLTVEIHDRGLDIAERYRFSLYDAMIVAAALLGKCATLYSEDLQHRQQIDQQLTIVNPFETS